MKNSIFQHFDQNVVITGDIDREKGEGWGTTLAPLKIINIAQYKKKSSNGQYLCYCSSPRQLDHEPFHLCLR